MRNYAVCTYPYSKKKKTKTDPSNLFKQSVILPQTGLPPRKRTMQLKFCLLYFFIKIANTLLQLTEKKKKVTAMPDQGTSEANNPRRGEAEIK